MKILLTYRESSKIRELANHAELQDVIKSTFGLEIGAFSLKVYDEDFKHYVDLEDTTVIQDKDKIRIDDLAPVQSFLCTSDSNSLIFTDDYVATNESGEGLEVEAEVVLSLRKEQWPNVITLPSNMFSGPLLNTLEQQKQLTWDTSRELVGHLANYCYRFKSYPNKKEREQVCLALISHYPYLKNPIGLGIGGWEIRLLNKLKKIRQADSSLEVKLKRSNNCSGKPPKRRCIKPKNGILNWAPDHFPGEDESTQSRHKEILKEEYKKSEKSRNPLKIENLMRLTYSFRRIEINEKSPICKLKEDYPFFFEPEQQIEEFQRLTAINIKQVYFKEVDNCGEKLVNLCKKAKLSEAAAGLFHKAIQQCDDTHTEQERRIKAGLGMMILPNLFNEPLDSFIQIIDSDSETQQMESINPIIFLNGDLSDGDYSIVIENIVVARVNCFVLATALFISFFYTLNITYPKSILNTLKFIQNFILKINDESPPPKVATLIKKLY